MSGLDATLGVKAESTYAAGVAVDRFYEQTKNTLAGKYERIDSEAVRAGSRFLRADRFAINPKGASGALSLEVLSKTFGFWLLQCLGAVTTEALADADVGAYTHTFTPASLKGQSFTAQVGKPDSTDDVHPFTYAGCKVTGWTISSDVDDIVGLEVDVDAASETIGGTGVNALVTADYSDLGGSELLTYVSGFVSIGGTEVKIGSVSFKGDNGLNADRWKQGATKREPISDKMSSVSWELALEFDDLTQVNRVASATAAGALAAIVTHWQAPTLITDTTKYPELQITCTNARFDGDIPTIDGAKMLELKLSGVALETDTDDAISIAYTCGDATP